MTHDTSTIILGFRWGGTSTMGMLPGGVCLNSNIFAGSVALVEVCALPSATL